MMWSLKGTLLGLWLLGFGTIAFVYLTLYRKLPIHVDVVALNTIQNPLWWAALVVCFVLSYAITRSWSGPPILWVALLVTGLVPAGMLALIIALVVKSKHAMHGH
jgi:hypothetical protein